MMDHQHHGSYFAGDGSYPRGTINDQSLKGDEQGSHLTKIFGGEGIQNSMQGTQHSNNKSQGRSFYNMMQNRMQGNDINNLEDTRKRHRRTATEIERHFVCQVDGCTKSYGSEGSLNQHMKLKHPEYYRQQIAAGNLQSGPGRISNRQAIMRKANNI